MRTASSEGSRRVDATGAAVDDAAEGSTRRDDASTGPLWRALRDTACFDAPHGTEVADVQKGMVIEESAYTADALGGAWIACESDDGTQIWTNHFELGRLSEEQVPLWERLDAEGAPLVATTAAAVATAAASAPLRINPEAVPDDVAAFAAFWKKRDGKPLTTRDWNTEFQRLLEQLAFLPPAAGKGATDKARGGIHQLYTDFSEAATEAVRTIVNEMYTPNSRRTIPAVGLGTYFANGMCLRLCVDTAAGAYGGDANAMKVAAQALRSQVHLLGVAPRYMLHVPLTFVLTFMGFRVVASTIPPVMEATQVVPADLNPSSCVVGAIVADCCRALNLKPHAIGGGRSTALPVDAGVYAGFDGRLYLLGTGRLMPPLAPTSKLNFSGEASIATLFGRVRPELILETTRHLSSDAFCSGVCSTEDNEDVTSMLQWCRDNGIPRLAAVLSFHEPPHIDVEPYNCCITRRGVENQIGFVICTNPDECCMISPQAAMDLCRLAYWSGKMDEAHARLEEAVSCGAPPRSLSGFVMKPDVTALCHGHGINVRFLPYVWGKIMPSAWQCSRHHIEVEMIARAAKHLLFKSLRACTDDDAKRTVCANFFAAVLSTGTEQAQAFWAEELGPAIGRLFDAHMPFNIDRIDCDLVHRRIAELTGLELSRESLASFYGNAPFVQLLAVHPVMKEVRIPHLVDTAGDRKKYLNEHRQGLVGYWERDGSVADKAWKAQRPAYLNTDLPWATDEDEA